PYDNAYWAEAYTAAKEAYDFAKAHGSALTASYDNIFLVEGGPEVLFAVINSYPSKTGSWDWYLRPQSLSTGQIQRGPTWDMIKSFPMADGKTWDDPTGKYYVSSEALLMQSFWKNRDPRFYSSVTCPGQLYPVAGRDASFRIYTALGLADDADAYGTNPHSGGAVSTKNDSYGGFFVRKAIDFSLTPDQSDEYSIDCVKMRFAELMFIYAEAANENGHSDVAVQMLKEIRQRAGLEAGDDGNYGLPANPTRDQIRDLILAERNTELCFEGFRFWDLRRTRHLDKLYGLQKFGLESIAINADGSEMDINDAKAKAKAFELTPDNFKYVKQMCPYTPSAENTFVVNESFYFFPIQQTLLDENPNLEQNNTWGGTFDPTME
ncbi:MAG: RagB/SusD family nutrient uptake outer membrane protein, partial [Mediterranea sp.]|nr:RagB/SusD family nutrient uptake outer membrane protein [Mediterranea sp.]